uniref:RFX-type winged-helix domain-containing protein n=1 Tax=Schistocephalus solidus TaxID=70667 RepID=A0A0X3PYZ8_SCHSO
MQPGSAQGATVIQVAKNNGATHTIIQQNGQHVLVGKLGNATNVSVAASVDSASLVSDSTSGTQSLQTLFPAQYIEAASEQTVYASSGAGGQVQYQEYAPIIYTPVCGGQTYYQAVGGQVLAGSGFSATGGSIVGATGGTSHAQIVTHQGATYILQGGAALEDDAASLSHTAKASPLTVQWLIDNYETAEGVSLPRSTLYFHYLQHCHENKLEPMNPASFGKLIRSVFLGLRTRRLGTRGNSKYHYYGIRIKPSSQLNHYVEDASFALRHYPNYHRQSMEVVAEWKSLAAAGSGSPANVGSQLKTSTPLVGGRSQCAVAPYGSASSTAAHQQQQGLSQSGLSGGSSLDDRNSVCSGGIGSTRQLSSTFGGQSKHQHSQFLGEASSALPNLDEICRSAGLPIPGVENAEFSPTSKSRNGSGDKVAQSGKKSLSVDGIPAEDLISFACLYALSAGNMLDAVVNLDFSAIANVWKAFWRTEESKDDSEFEKALPKERLYALSKSTAVHQFIRLYDHTFYQSLAEVLIPNVLRPIPPTLTQAIRNFAKNLEMWMRHALQQLDPVLLRLKLSAVSALAQTLRRYTSLNHLAQAARAVLKNSSQINQMLIDLSRVDFNNVQEQASWVCQCSDATVAHLEQDFKYILQKQSSLEEWAQWLDTVVTGILRPLEGNNLAYTRAAHQLVLKWSFYSSMVIRDLTLRSAASFGSFHLIRLLYDEYIFYLVEQKVAAHLGMTPVAVMGEMGRAITRPQNFGRSTVDSARRRDAKVASGKLEDALASAGSSETVILSVNLANENNSDSTIKEGAVPPPDETDEVVCEAFGNSVFTGVTECEEEVDEYLDDEDEPDDLTGDENAMLRRAHESVQALCRNAALERNKLPLGDSDATNQSEVTASIKTSRAEIPSAAATAANSGDVDSSECNGTPKASEVESAPAAAVDLKVSLCSNPPSSEEATLAASTFAEPLGGCDSPPPILTLATPARKVVRVTTFDETQSSAPSEDSLTTSGGTAVAVSVSSSAPLIIPSDAKRVKLS